MRQKSLIKLAQEKQLQQIEDLAKVIEKEFIQYNTYISPSSLQIDLVGLIDDLIEDLGMKDVIVQNHVARHSYWIKDLPYALMLERSANTPDPPYNSAT